MPRPTLEQIRATPGGRSRSARRARPRCPRRSPPIIGELAAEVTAGDHERLRRARRAAALVPRRASSATRSTRPSRRGSTASGTDAVAKFLEVREGYCIHFASAFALMARTLGMPSRIVVGYLPGSATSDAIDRETVYSVSSGQLHAWPEVHLRGHRLGAVRADQRPRRSDDASRPPDRRPAARTIRAAATPAPTSSASADPGLVTRRAGGRPERRRGRRDRKHRQPAARARRSCSASCSRWRSPACCASCAGGRC